MTAERTIMLVDMDAFFASIETAQRPWLKGKPVVVVGGAAERSVVSASSYEAKALGIRAGMPVANAKHLCPGAAFIQADLNKYVYVSGRMVELFEKFSPLVEPASIDECYIDISGTRRMLGEPELVARRLKTTIREQFDLTASIGIAPNKTWAKIACGMGKPDGLIVIDDKDIIRISETLPIRKLPGVGNQTEIMLNKLGIFTISDIARYPSESLERLFGVCGLALHRLACGIDDSAVVPWQKLPRPKSVGHEYTFPEDVSDIDELRGILAWLTGAVVQRMRQMNAVARTVQLKLRYDDFRTFTRRRTAGIVSCEKDAYRHLEDLLCGIIERGKSVRQLGVVLSGLRYSESVLPEIDGLFPEHARRHARTAIDEIQNRYGTCSICWGRAAKWLFTRGGFLRDGNLSP